MDYFLTDQQKEIRSLARKIAEKNIRPLSAHYDQTGTFPWPLVKLMADNDLFRVFIDEAYGGIACATPILNSVLVMEELSRACAGTALSFGGTMLGALPLIISGDETQKRRFLPDVAAGKKLASLALSESQAGSDIGAVACTARRSRNSYILNGAKKWITNGGEADIYAVFCLTNPERGLRGSSCILVEKGTPGLNFGKVEDKLGIRASVTREVILTDCRVPVKNRLGAEGSGPATVLKAMAIARTGIAAQALGIAQGAADLASEYACKRQQFGKPLTAFQGMRFLLADMAIQLEAARSLIYSVARHMDFHAEYRETPYSAMAKCFASNAAMNITVNAMQVFGAYGYVRDCPVEKYLRDAKITQIYEGTNQILMDEIGKMVTRRAMRAGH
jgi:alkylation response protein AidB-like acyl-CoA dehydrogenase